jgi:hypothetical protein
LKLGFSAKIPGFIQAGLFLVEPMTDEPSTLYAKLLGETAVIEWKALERFWAKGDLIWVEPTVDLIEVAQAMAENRAESVALWRNAGTVGAVTAEQALDLQSRDPEIWAVVVSPFILIQERKSA